MATHFGWLNNEDLNGECFVAGEVGEVEEAQNHRKVYFAPNSPAAVNPGDAVIFTQDQVTEFFLLNVTMLAHHEGVAIGPKHAKVAYLRYLAVRNGLISPAFRPGDHNVRYTEAVRLNATAYGAVPGMAKVADIPVAMLPDADRTKLRKNFSNIVCCVAYMFRVRGHHWLPEMDAKYANLWRKCVKEDTFPVLEWQYIAHESLHAIFPDVLDDFWLASVAGGKVVGALEKRLDSAPAGCAAVRVVYSGAQDLQMAIPGIKAKFQHHFDELENIVGQMRANRWAGSINRRYYNAPKIDFDEQKFGAIASVIFHSLNAFAASSPMLQSKALERVANNAPITGGIVSRSIATAASNPRIVESLLLPDLK